MTVVGFEEAASCKPTTVATFPLEVLTVVGIRDAASSISTTVATFGGKVVTVVGFHDATSSKPTTVTKIRRTASVQRSGARTFRLGGVVKNRVEWPSRVGASARQAVSTEPARSKRLCERSATPVDPT